MPRKNRSVVGVTLDQEQLAALDWVRGRTPRARYLRRLLDSDPAMQSYWDWLEKLDQAGLLPPRRKAG
jgi:hypothetical protein